MDGRKERSTKLQTILIAGEFRSQRPTGQAAPTRIMALLASLTTCKVGVEELDREKLPPLLKLKYNDAIADAWADLGRPEEVGYMFAGFQKYLYQQWA